MEKKAKVTNYDDHIHLRIDKSLKEKFKNLYPIKYQEKIREMIQKEVINAEIEEEKKSKYTIGKS